ncbi:MAG: sugar ABC transporter permease [Rhodospirillaceae bacterium]|nr:sugar ABC transporter permease [Rhodospirillaceae bacterium]|tara:strand:- start:3564 stop:4427 length:864 start_codon:yes stop_codon:yes gene_type:complete
MNKNKFILFCILPSIVILLIVVIFPMVGAINYSLQDKSLRFLEGDYIGFQNYIDMFEDRRFINALKISLYWELITVIGSLLLAILVSIILFEYSNKNYRILLAIILIMPIMLPKVSAGLIWRFMLSPVMGLVNAPLISLNLNPIEYLASPKLALFSVAFVDIWQWGLFFGVILLFLLETLPRDLIDAAKIDKVKKWQLHYFITFPMLKGSLITIALIKAIESLRSFDLIFTMTKGGPGITTETLDLYAYQQGIGLRGEISYASAMSVAMVIITIVIFTFIWKRAQKN